MADLKRKYLPSLGGQAALTLVLMVMRKGCPMAVMTWPLKVSQNLVRGSSLSSYAGNVERPLTRAPRVSMLEPNLIPTFYDGLDV